MARSTPSRSSSSHVVGSPAMWSDVDDPQVELDHLLARRDAAARRAELRGALLRRTDVTTSIDAIVLLLPAELDAELQRELDLVGERIAVLRHCPSHLPDVVDRLAVARAHRDRLTEQVAATRRTVRLAFDPADVTDRGSTPSRWRRPSPVVRELLTLVDGLVRRSVSLVDDIVAADVLVVVDPRAVGLGAVVRCADPSTETRARVVAFADEIARIAAVHDRAIRHHRLAGDRARAAAEPEPDRRPGALASLDSIRALHAAIAEIEALDELDAAI